MIICARRLVYYIYVCMYVIHKQNKQRSPIIVLNNIQNFFIFLIEKRQNNKMKVVLIGHDHLRASVGILYICMYVCNSQAKKQRSPIIVLNNIQIFFIFLIEKRQNNKMKVVLMGHDHLRASVGTL